MSISNLNRIVRVDISLNMPPVDVSSFDHLLIIGPPPVNPTGNIRPVEIYSDLLEVTSAGYVSTGANADPVGAAARIAFSQMPRPDHIFVTNYTPKKNKPPKDDDKDKNNDYITDPSLETVLNTTLKTNGWYVLCPAGIGTEYYHQIAQWTESQRKMFAYSFLSEADPVPDIFMRSHGWCGLVDEVDLSLTPQDNHYAHIAATARTLVYPAGSETWNLKNISSITPGALSTTLFRMFEEGNSNWIERIAGTVRTRNGKVRGGEWIDTIRFRDWLQNDLQLRILEVLTSKSKIAYTDAEIDIIHNALIAGLKNAQRRGGIAPNEYDESGNPVPGFTTSVPNASSLTARQRHSRRLEDVTFQARLAGAIHFVHVRGNLSP